MLRSIPVIMMLATFTAAPLRYTSAEDNKDGVTIRLADTKPTDGWTENISEDRDAPLYLHPEPLMTAEDVTSVTFSRAIEGQSTIGMTFRPEAAKILRDATAKHIGKPIVVQLDGEVILAPRVNGTISEKAQLNGDFSKKELRRLFEALVLH